jgi:hypothetical protein
MKYSSLAFSKKKSSPEGPKVAGYGHYPEGLGAVKSCMKVKSFLMANVYEAEHINVVHKTFFCFQ